LGEYDPSTDKTLGHQFSPGRSGHTRRHSTRECALASEGSVKHEVTACKVINMALYMASKPR
jgi:hypothetical protein